jgi:hypothetical protein
MISMVSIGRKLALPVNHNMTLAIISLEWTPIEKWGPLSTLLLLYECALFIDTIGIDTGLHAPIHFLLLLEYCALVDAVPTVSIKGNGFRHAEK